MYQTSTSVCPAHYRDHLVTQLLQRTPVDRNSWQSTSAPSPAHELANVILTCSVPPLVDSWQKMCSPDLPWADIHFSERVSGIPLNPPPSYDIWPWHSKKNADQFMREGKKEKFDHTYPERYWPDPDIGGNLRDVVKLLDADTWTRQAYLPVYFPEDTGTRNGQRVPCSLGYHFIRNGGQLDCNYFIRSCDLTRHFLNDVYLTGRLLQWVHAEISTGDWPTVGDLTVFISNLHLFTNDEWRFK